MMARPRTPARLIFDLESTVLVLYDKQERARVGYNPIKPGRRSYYPLLCFEAQTRDFWHGGLRLGDVGTPRGALECVQACFAKAPRQGQRVGFVESASPLRKAIPTSPAHFCQKSIQYSA